MKLKILFSITYYTPYISGLTIYVARLAQELVKRAYKVSILTSRHDQHLPILESRDGMEIRRVPVQLRLGKGVIMPLWPIRSWQAVWGNDVLIVNLPQLEGFFPALFVRLLGKKIIAIYHCEVILPEGRINKLIERTLWVANLVSIKLAHKVITYTQDYANHSRLLSLVKDKIITIYPPVPKPLVDDTLREKYEKIVAKKAGEFIIGFAGRVSAEKGIEYLLDAIKKVNVKCSAVVKASADKQISKITEVKLVIAGPREEVVGEASYLQKIDRLTRELGEQVIFLGAVPEDGMGAFYSLIDVLVLPSINSTEAFGMVQVEAMLLGVPVIASDLPGVRVPIQKTGMGRIVPIKNSQALAEAIVEVLTHRKTFVKDANAVKKEFSLEKTVGFYEDLLCNLN